MNLSICKYYFAGAYCSFNPVYHDDGITFFYCKGKCEHFKNKKEIPSRYISKSTRYEVLNRQHWSCNICGKHLKYSENHSFGDVVAHIDHIHPFSQWESYDGDINENCNLEALCPECNMRKHAKNGF